MVYGGIIMSNDILSLCNTQYIEDIDKDSFLASMPLLSKQKRKTIWKIDDGAEKSVWDWFQPGFTTE